MPKDTNSVNDEIRNERRKVLENMDTKEKIKYFVGYYKWHAIFTILGLIFVISFIVSIVTAKDVKFQYMVVNGNTLETDYEAILSGFDATLDYNRKKEECKVEYGLAVDPEDGSDYGRASIQKIFMSVMTGDVNVILCDDVFMKFTRAQDTGANLGEVLPKEMLEKYEDKLVYYDFPNEECGDNPENEGRYEAVCIDVSDFNKIKESNMFPNGEAYAFIVISSKDIPLGVEFLKYLDE